MTMRSLGIGVAMIFIFISGCKKDSAGTGAGGGGTTITVNGFVKDVNGSPINAAAVLVTGKVPVTSGSNGGFSVADVSTPYDITLIRSAERTAIVYKGLTRSDPVLHFTQGTGGTQRTATITGTVPASTATTRVFFTSGDKLWVAVVLANVTSYTINASWYDTNTVFAGQLHVLRWTSTGGLPSNYTAYGSRSLTINAGTTSSGNNFVGADLSDPSEGTISGTVVRPSGFNAVNQRTLRILFGNAWMDVATQAGSLADDFNYTVPNASGATFGVNVTSNSSGRLTSYFKNGISGGATGVAVMLEAPPQLSLPVNNATDIDTSVDFQWSQGGGNGVNRVLIADGGGNPIFYVYTTGATTRIPNLAAQGLSLPSNTSYSWIVVRFHPLSSTNDAASDSYTAFSNSNTGDRGRMESESFSFRTRP